MSAQVPPRQLRETGALIRASARTLRLSHSTLADAAADLVIERNRS